MLSDQNAQFICYCTILCRYIWREDSMATELPHQADQPAQKGTSKAQQAGLLPHHTDYLWAHHIKMEVSDSASSELYIIGRRDYCSGQ